MWGDDAQKNAKIIYLQVRQMHTPQCSVNRAECAEFVFFVQAQRLLLFAHADAETIIWPLHATGLTKFKINFPR